MTEIRMYGLPKVCTLSFGAASLVWRNRVIFITAATYTVDELSEREDRDRR